ncbi:MAG: hypothetical protein Q4D80_03140 [Pseudomonadota bacterium]|nr:hypothetical protein [Pseudomonadota bacterium]
MSRYSDYETLKNSADFQAFRDFVRNELNRDIDDMAEYERQAMFYKFKVRSNDIDEDDKKFLDNIEASYSPEELDELTETHFPAKKYNELEPEDKAFIAVERNAASLLGISNEDIKSYLQARNSQMGMDEQEFTSDEDVYDAFHELADKHRYAPDQEQFNEFIRKKNAYLSTKTEEEKAEVEGQLSRFLNNEDSEKMFYGSELYVVEDDFREMYAKAATQVNSDDKSPLHVIVPGQDRDPNTNDRTEEEEKRWRSFNSDMNDMILDQARLATLADMGKVSEEETADSTPEHIIELLNKKMPELSDAELAEFESRMTDKLVAEYNDVFELLPPAVLAKAYTNYDQRIAGTNDENIKNELSARKEKVSARMSQLTEMLANEGRTWDDLYFADVTNIADVYDGYVKMFDVMDKNWRSPKDGGAQAQKMRQGEYKLREEFDKYKEEWNLKDLTEKDADRLQKRYEELSKELQSVEPDKDTAALVSNFKFLDAEGKVEPQFVDKAGNQSDSYSEGAKVIEGSKLDTAIRLAKQKILLENLGTDTKLKKEDLQQALSETLPETLYAFHVNAQVEKDVLENPKQFTDKKFLRQFVADLADPNKTMEVSHTAFEAGVQNAVNATAGYAGALAQTVGPDKSIIGSVFEPVKDFDKRKDARFENKTSKRAVRIEMLTRGIKGGLSAFLVSGAITAVGTMSAADAGITAATGGLNKMAGMAIGVTLGVAMTIKQVYSWHKRQKKEGKPAGLKALLKDRKMVMTIGTTALGAAALGFAATGNPGVAKTLGVGALVLGSANGMISNYQDSRKAGLGKLESAGWATYQTVMNTLGALGGRIGANAGIDAYNQKHPDNTLFQHEKVTVYKVSDGVEVTYKDGVVDGAKNTLSKWYGGNEDLLQQRVDEINNYNATHNTHVDPYRYLLAAHDAGARTPDNILLHNQGAPDVHSHGNHFVLADGWSAETGISQETVGSLANSVTPDGHVNLSAESIKAFNQIDGHINQYNQVGYVNGAPYQDDKVLDFNASPDADGRYVQDSHGDRYTTYADNKGIFDEQQKYKYIKTSNMIRNEEFDGVGMFGIMGNFLGIKKLKERAGALADRIIGKKVEKSGNKEMPPVQSEDKTKKDKTSRGVIIQNQRTDVTPEQEAARTREQINKKSSANTNTEQVGDGRNKNAEKSERQEACQPVTQYGKGKVR